MFSTRNRLSSLLHFKNAIPFELESLASGVSLLCSFCNDTYFDEIELYINVRSGEHLSLSALNPLSTNPPKWSNTLKQFVGCCLTEKTTLTALFFVAKQSPILFFEGKNICLFVCVLFWNKKHICSYQFDLCGRIGDKKFFTQPISGNKTTFFGLKFTYKYHIWNHI